MDVLSDILQTMKLRGTVYFHASFCAPWGMEIPAGEFANFHVVTRGNCWLWQGDTSAARQLAEGAIAIFPHGSRHSLACDRDAEIVPARNLLSRTAHAGTGDERAFGGDGEATTDLICGHFAYERSYPHPLFETLDELVLLSGRDNVHREWIRTASALAAHTSGTAAPGAGAVVDRLAEALFIQALAAHVATLDERESFLAAIQDRQIGHVLGIMHTDIAHEWTLDKLARAVALSRSNFAGRFRALVGEPPMIYLARWRMIKARELLQQTRRSIPDISEAVGYRSEFAFSKAFKKITGDTPGSVRRALRSN